ncbi:hypothetical protein DFH94DRAFT_775848 [Russula ochroleuca]|uniref:Uncharacterized protein n=1 Tax=Russula ochroleuca TaxID=152965 RepID=A0A9P5JY63_9AGAM|nr:hypothetical protein DFH94DRAFT_775848 [Russula ochroleuca]
MLSETLEAPQLRHLALVGFVLLIQSRLLTTAVRLVSLCLFMSSRHHRHLDVRPRAHRARLCRPIGERTSPSSP